MFTLESFHFTSLILAFLITSLYLVSYFGLSVNGRFFTTFVAFPFLLASFSLLLPFQVFKYFVVSLFVFGLIRGFYNLRQFEFKSSYKSFVHFYKDGGRLHRFLIWFIGIHILSGLIGTTVLGGEGAIVDAMTYHLGGPKEWALFLNGPKLSVINPESLTASYYEYLVYPMFVFAKPLYETFATMEKTHHEFLSYTLLLFGQLFSGIVGLVFIPKVLWNLYREKKDFFFYILILLLGMKGMNWTWKTAKNDAFPLLCALVSYNFFLGNINREGRKKSFVVFISFFLLGIGLGAKLTNLYPMLFILSFMFLSNFERVKKSFSSFGELFKYFSIATIGGLVSLLPFLLRNYIETSNPLYPTSSMIFENIYLTEATDAFHKLYSHPTTWSIAIEKLKKLYVYSPGFILISVVSIYFKQWIQPCLFMLVMFLISKITGERFMWRQISMILFFIVIWGESLFKLWKENRAKIKLPVGQIIIILILGLSQFKPERLTKYPYRHYFRTLKEVMPKNYYAWREQLEENLKYRNNESKLTNYSSYFSRFRHLNLTDSRQKFRKQFLRNEDSTLSK